MASFPRAVVVRRSTDYEALLARHATRGQASFFLETRGQDIDVVEAEHARVHAVLSDVLAAIPQRWRHVEIRRGDLNRFLFEPDDIVIAVGQDGLVANIAKYLEGQLVIGVNPLPERFDGVLARLVRGAVPGLLGRIDGHGSLDIEARAMVEASLDGAETIVALNELFVGHRTHQSARYRLQWGGDEERQSSSGIIIATGTGSTGWARSINESWGGALALPAPTERDLAFFVREAFPSVSTGTGITLGLVAEQERLRIVSEMNESGVVFGDGIEDDFLSFDWGRTLTVGVASRPLNLVIG